MAWAGFTYVSFIVDVFAQKIIAWHAATSKDVNLVMTLTCPRLVDQCLCESGVVVVPI